MEVEWGLERAPTVSSMLQGHSPVSQALLGTFFTWGMTAAGAALVFIFSSGQVMLAASYWSLLAPAVEMATSSGGFGALAFFPVAVGFTLGAAFVYLADLLMPHLGAAEDPQTALALNFDPALMKKKSDAEGPRPLFPESELSIRIGRAGLPSDKSENGEAYQRKKAVASDLPEGPAAPMSSRGNPTQPSSSSWRRIALLILAITVHNVPEGLAVGVGFGAVEKTASATFESARRYAAQGHGFPQSGERGTASENEHLAASECQGKKRRLFNPGGRMITEWAGPYAKWKREVFCPKRLKGPLCQPWSDVQHRKGKAISCFEPGESPTLPDPREEPWGSVSSREMERADLLRLGLPAGPSLHYHIWLSTVLQRPGCVFA
ncbi:zinc transporter ZIP11 isoform X3 [Camelus ferus]|uniref:Zinc transporter ZIP11 n=1 Tax=Camelus ferus TaxID=419612 RepID=A0A8B8R4H2_CAMFR|nr:zinc transporter ZIP11 isoform X3 [Camelus ferus]